MPIRFICPQCNKPLKAPDEYAGKLVRCSGCQAVQVVPAPVAAAAPGPGVSSVASMAAVPADAGGDQISLRKKQIEDDGLDMTPMVDVVFLLLIFFMVTAAFALQKSLEIPAPDVTEGAAQSRTLNEIEQDDDYVIVQIDKDNTVWVNGSEAPSEQELLSRLREARQGSPGSTSPGPSKLLVMASGDARHEKVVMALDAGTVAGMEEVRLANADDEL
ncbi:MAG: biopolymer transporter ExbD [Pirellulales bacterium]